jgi:ribosomal protein S18 acetylase RimI-like enzyme
MEPIAAAIRRVATSEDRPWLEQLRRAVYRDLFFATWGGWDEARHVRHFTECWARGGIHCIEVDGERIGMIQLLERPDAVEIGEIQIQPTHQGRGIGTRLLRDTIALAHAQRKKVTLSTGSKNHRAFALYQRLGFRHVARTETHDYMELEPGS